MTISLHKWDDPRVSAQLGGGVATKPPFFPGTGSKKDVGTAGGK